MIVHSGFAGIFKFYQLPLLITSRLKFKTNLQNLTFKDNKFGGSHTCTNLSAADQLVC